MELLTDHPPTIVVEVGSVCRSNQTTHIHPMAGVYCGRDGLDMAVRASCSPM